MPTAIVYTAGDATRPSGADNRVIVHVCNDEGGWGKGFVVAISKRWPEPEARYREWYRERGDNDFGLGVVQFVKVEDSLWVANLVGQRGLRSVHGVPPIRYEAVAEGLGRVARFATQHHASVHMPRIGCGLAGGTWDRIEPLITKELCELSLRVTVYDFA